MVYVDTGAGVGAPDAELTNDARLDIPSTVICTGYTCKEYRDAVEAGYDFLDSGNDDMCFGQKPREIAVTFVGDDEHAPAIRDQEVVAGDAGVRGFEALA